MAAAGGSTAPQSLQVVAFVTDPPKFEIDLYIQNYKGRTRYDRLLLIGKCCPPLCVEALKAAVAEAKSGSDVFRYLEAWECLRSVAPGEPEAQRDEDWIVKTGWENKNETSRLETELKGYKNNLIKESIRMGHEDLGKHFESIGMLSDAAEAYSKMRQDASTTKHLMDCGMHLANVAMQRRDWSTALNSVAKIASLHSGDDDQLLQAYIKLVCAIAMMGQEQYEEAAKTILLVNPIVTPAAYSHVTSPNDIAIYGGLLALATMNRADLQSRVLENQSFRTFLEQEPHVRKAISSFVNGRYSTCLTILESVRSEYLLDIYLHSHISELYRRIRTKCIVQYFIPFSCVSLESLDASFAQSGQSIEDELVRMIRDKSLDARIDSKNKLLVAVAPEPRLAMQRNAIKVTLKYELEAKERLRRMNIMAEGLEVAGGKSRMAGIAGGSNVDDTWFEDNGPLIDVQKNHN